MSTFKFAIMGAAAIAEKFCGAVRLIDGAEVIAVAGKTESRLKEFAEKQGIPKYYVGYEELLKNEKPDCVYIAAVTSLHYELTMMCLNYGVPVLCEKAMFTNSKEADEAFALAKEKGVFAMEAMWSRFLPAIRKAKQWIVEGRIGKVGHITCNIGWVCPKDDNNRFYSKELGGGAAFDLLVYSYELSTFMHPHKITTVNSVTTFAHTGVDATEQVTLQFEDGAVASISASIVTQLDECLVICGDKGRIEVPSAHFANQAKLYDLGRNVTEHFVDTETENGFVYEAQEAMRCVREGKLESETVPHKETLACSKVFDRVMGD